MYVVEQPPSSSGTSNKPTSNALDEPDMDINNVKSLLEVREAHVLKLNKQNVNLQEENDNLLNEIEKVSLLSIFCMQSRKIYNRFF